MKKKIKDLTLEEANKYCCSRQCKDCPLKYADTCYLDLLAGFSLKDDLDFQTREVDVDE